MGVAKGLLQFAQAAAGTDIVVGKSVSQQVAVQLGDVGGGFQAVHYGSKAVFSKRLAAGGQKEFVGGAGGSLFEVGAQGLAGVVAKGHLTLFDSLFVIDERDTGSQVQVASF